MSVDNLMYVKVCFEQTFALERSLTVVAGGPDYPRRTSTTLLEHARRFSCLLQHYTFYDFIVNKARGKSGPLFNFDVHDDIRLLADASVEKDESHAGKVVERSWYQRNKHIFPASRWEVSRQMHSCCTRSDVSSS